MTHQDYMAAKGETMMVEKAAPTVVKLSQIPGAYTTQVFKPGSW